MLKKLFIQNFALFEKLEISFSPGLNVLTGETGAGKSLVINALNSILGEKVSTDILRKGSEKVIVEGTFEGRFDDINRLLLSNDLDSFDNELLLRRELNRSGRSRTFINDCVTQMDLLKQISNCLVDLHGQHDHQSLLKQENHVDYLDDFGLLSGKIDLVKKLFSETEKLIRQMENLQANSQKLKEKKEYLEFQIKEIDLLNLNSAEEQELHKEEKILQNYEELINGCNFIHSSLYENEDSVYTKLGNIISQLEKLSDIDTNFSEQQKQISDSYLTIEEVARFVHGYISKTDYDPERLEQIRFRLDKISRIKSKYGLTLAEIIEKNNINKQEISQIENLDDDLKRLDKQIKQKKELLGTASRDLSKYRKNAAQKLEGLILAEIKQVGMEHALFRIQFDPHFPDDEGGITLDSGLVVKSNGQDRVEFFVSANPGEDCKPIVKIASGGELSRIMLALKSVIADKDRIDVLVFDEIDIGISGRIAEAVGRKIKKLSKSHQIICVTHLPQIAGFADKHFSVRKKIKNGETFAFLQELDYENRIRELAYLLGGEKITGAALKNARELIESSER